MTTKPTKYPDFAMDDVVDPTSGQPNIIEPSTGKKSDGWVYNEKPPRQYFNWLARLTSQWIRWIDDYLTNTVLAHINATGTAVHGLGTASTHASTDFQAALTNGSFTISPAGFTGLPTITVTWEKDANGIVTMKIPAFSGSANNDYTREGLYFFYSGGISAGATPAADKIVPCLLIDEGIVKAGSIVIESSGYLCWKLGILVTGGFNDYVGFNGESFHENTVRGMPEQTIIFSV